MILLDHELLGEYGKKVSPGNLLFVKHSSLFIAISGVLIAFLSRISDIDVKYLFNSTAIIYYDSKVNWYNLHDYNESFINRSSGRLQYTCLFYTNYLIIRK